MKSCYIYQQGKYWNLEYVFDESKYFLFHIEGTNWLTHPPYAILLKLERAEPQAGTSKEELCGIVLM